MGKFVPIVFASVMRFLVVFLGQIGVRLGIEWVRHRHLRWLWTARVKMFSPNLRQRSVAITFSSFEHTEPIPGRQTQIKVSHVGDVQAAALVQRVLVTDLRRSAELMPAGITLEEHSDKDIICIGGPAFNRTTQQLLSTHSKYLPVLFGQDVNGMYYLSERGRPEITYHHRVADQRTAEDWALVLKLPHPYQQPTEHDTAFCLVLAGLSTFGTLAAARFVTDSTWLKKLRKSLHFKDGRFFCALLRTWPTNNYLDVSDIKLIHQWSIVDPLGQ